MRRCRAATSTNHLCASHNQMPRVARHVFRTRHVHGAAAYVSRHSCIRLRTQLAGRERCHLFDGLEYRLRTNRTIKSDYISTRGVERTGNVFWCRAVRSNTIGVDRYLRNYRHRRVNLTCGDDCLRQLVEIRKCLKDEQIRAAFLKRVHLLGVRLEPYGSTSRDEARAIFAEQMHALKEGGADLFILETFSDLD